MEKRELYDALTRKGAKLRAYSRVTVEELQTMWDMVEASEKAKHPQGNPPALRFANAGWCDELQCSYYIGNYTPRSWGEYDALKKYAVEDGR